MPSVVELFAGQGGFIAGFDKVKGWNHLAAVEIEARHCYILRQIFPGLNVIQGDVDKVNWRKVLRDTEVDCVVGGPPCQPFSRGSKEQNGWNDLRNGIPLFVNAVRAIKPKTFLMENVAALWWKRYHPYVEDIIRQFKKMGFEYTEVGVLDAADFGAPCHRRRLFIYGTRFEHNWPVRTHAQNHVGSRQYLVPLLEAREPDGSPLPEWVKPKIRGAKGDIVIDCKQGNKVGRQFVSLDEPCFTLVATQGIRHRIRLKGRYYRVRATEGAALQGMDPRCTVEGIGNAVNVWQAEAWAKTIRDYLLSLKDNDDS